MALIAASALAIPALASASSIYLNFNDLNTGALEGQGGGSGGSGNWAGSASAVSQVISGDLGTPTGTNYTPSQGGTPHSVQSTSGSTGSNTGAYRTLATPMTGTVWFSFLVEPVDGTSRIGVGINGEGSFGGGYRILAVGQGLFTTSAGATSGTYFTTGASNLIVGQITASTGNEELKIWVNPNTATFQSSTPTPTYDSGIVANHGITGSNGDGNVLDLTPISYTSGGTTNGIIDNIIFSNDSNAETEALTGTPEPAALGLIGLTSLGLLRRRHCR